MDLQTTLTNIANGMRVARDGPTQVQPGQPVGVRLIPTTLQLSAPALADGALNLLFITKNVRFKDATALPTSLTPTSTNPDILGGMPIPTTVTGTLEGVQGVLGQLSGSLPIPLQVPVSVTVQWSVRDAPAPQGKELVSGTDYLAPDGLQVPEISLIFPADVVELTKDATLPAKTLFIHAKVQLSAQGVTTPFIDLPEVPITIPALAIPTVAAFFRHADFRAVDGDNVPGAVLIMVPANSPFRSLDQLAPVLTSIQSLLSSLTALPRFATFLLGLEQLTSALAALQAPRLQFRAAEGIGSLEDVVYVEGIVDEDADDDFSSLVLIAASDASEHTVDVFNDSDFNPDEGAFKVSVGPEMHAIVANFDGKTPSVQPAGAVIQVTKLPPGGLIEPDKFNDEASSIQFSSTPSVPNP